MHAAPAFALAVRSTLQRAVAATGCVLLAAIVAAGCGSDEPTTAAPTGAGGGASGIAGKDGVLGWLPSDTWLVASVDVSPSKLGAAVETLGRLPIWALAEGYLPASDGAGLRRAALREAAAQAGVDLDAATLERAIGRRVGIAATSTKLERLEADAPGLVVWAEVDDAGAARRVAGELLGGATSRREHDGVAYRAGRGDESGAYLIDDGLLLMTATARTLEQLIDAHGSGAALASNEQVDAVVEAGIGSAMGGWVVQTTEALRAAPNLLDAPAVRLDGERVDALLPDFVAGGATIDEVGVRLTGAWSQPHELADPDEGARELVERMPADAVAVSGLGTDGSTLERTQAAWQELRDALDLRLDALQAQCDVSQAASCTLGAQLARTALEDRGLADALDDAGAGAIATTLQSGALQTAAAAAGVDAGTAPTRAPVGRVVEVATTIPAVDWAPSTQLGAALAAAGASREPEQVDDVRIWGLPARAPSAVAAALAGDAPTLGDDDGYEAVIDAADVPDDVGSFAWIDLPAAADALLAIAAREDPKVDRARPTVANNFSDLPGLVWWTSRTESEGEQVGVGQVVIPILE